MFSYIYFIFLLFISMFYLKDETFQEIENDAIIRILTGKALFLKFWNIKIDQGFYDIVPLPGRIKGVSGSSIGGTAIGINKYITKEHIKYAVEAAKFMTSWETQKKMVLNGIAQSVLPDIYYDEEVCHVVNCELYRNIQAVARPLTANYDDYSAKFRKNIRDFLYNGKDAEEVLKNIVDITKIYEITINPSKNHKEGFVVLIFVSIITVIILFTIIFVIMNKKKSYLNFLRWNCWIVILFGYIIHLFVVMINYGKITSLKCHLRYILLSFGITLSNFPILYKLICNFPDAIKIKIWIENNKKKFFFLCILFDVIAGSIFMVTPFNIKYFIIDEKNIRMCQFNNGYGIIVSIIMLLEKILILLGIVFFSFLEWNIKETKKDVRQIMKVISVDSFLYTLYILPNIINVKHYKIYFLWTSLALIMYVVTNLIMLFIIPILRVTFIKEDKNNIHIESLVNKFSTTESSNKNEMENRHSSNDSFIKNIMKYHINTNSIIDQTSSSKNYSFNVESSIKKNNI